jgi:RNA-directed DNA polymerase
MDVYVSGQSDQGIRPMKASNKAPKAAEVLEERLRAKGNFVGSAPAVALYTGKGSIGLSEIRKAAERDREIRFTSLMHHITVDLLWDACKALKRNAAPGIDDMTWKEYEEVMEEKIPDLHRRLHSGTYRAKPSKRIYLPKPDGRKRPIGIASLEDKVVQQATVWILNGIYEVDFANFSYGFRPGRSQHNALDAVWSGISYRKVCWVIDADIKGFFDNIRHDVLMEFLEKRIADKRILRLIRKWLRAGVSDDGEWSKTELGTPQGAVISPLLGNIYLHYGLDQWVKEWRRTQTKGDMIFVRYADDSVAGLQYRHEATTFLEAFKLRMKEIGLELHGEKTRLIEFGRFAARDRKMRGDRKPETFDFLGFTHICSLTRKNRKFCITRKTISKKMKSKISEIRKDLMASRHDSIHSVGKRLRSIILGYYNYHSVPGNGKSMSAFQYHISRAWLQALRRRSQKGQNMTWAKFSRYLKMWIPTPRVVHPYPNERLFVK